MTKVMRSAHPFARASARATSMMPPSSMLYTREAPARQAISPRIPVPDARSTTTSPGRTTVKTARWRAARRARSDNRCRCSSSPRDTIRLLPQVGGSSLLRLHMARARLAVRARAGGGLGQLGDAAVFDQFRRTIGLLDRAGVLASLLFPLRRSLTV